MTPDDLAVMVEKVVASPTLPGRYRDKARRLLGFPPDQSIRVESELDRLADEYARNADYKSPTTDLYRVVPVGAVQRHMAEPSLRAIDVRTYLAEAEASGDPAVWVRRTIPAGVIVFQGSDPG